MSAVQPFDNGEFHLDMTVAPDGSFTVQAPGLATALGVRDAHNLLRVIPGPEKGYSLVSTPGGDQQVGFVTEAGFYRAIGQRQAARVSDPAVRASVERFQSWVYGKVLPQVRRTGSYGTAPELTGPQLLAHAVIEAQRVIDEQAQALAVAAPKAEAFDAFLSTTGDYSVRDAAHVLSRHHDILTGEKRLRDWMIAAGWLYRDQTGAPRTYQRRIDQAVLAERVQWHYHPETGEKVTDSPQVRVTTRGIEALARALTRTTDQGELVLEATS